MDKHLIETLLADCRSGNPALQAAAVIVIEESKIYLAVPTLLKLLESSDPSIRATTAHALGYLGQQELETVGYALTNLLADPEVIVRSETVEALGRLHYTPAIELVKFLLRNDPDDLVRTSAAETIGELGNSQAVSALEQALLVDSDDSVRAYAAISIGLLGTPELLPKLQNYIESEPSLQVKVELLAARYWLGATEDLNLLLGFLETADENLATIILNILTDLMKRKPPSKLASDAPSLYEVLSALSERFTWLSPHAKQIISHLKLFHSESN